MRAASEISIRRRYYGVELRSRLRLQEQASLGDVREIFRPRVQAPRARAPSVHEARVYIIYIYIYIYIYNSYFFIDSILLFFYVAFGVDSQICVYFVNFQRIIRMSVLN